jgi:hypothetical protein
VTVLCAVANGRSWICQQEASVQLLRLGSVSPDQTHDGPVDCDHLLGHLLRRLTSLLILFVLSHAFQAFFNYPVCMAVL